MIKLIWWRLHLFGLYGTSGLVLTRPYEAADHFGMEDLSLDGAVSAHGGNDALSAACVLLRIGCLQIVECLMRGG